jgi:O-antigen/teichoic acid export membrane protein
MAILGISVIFSVMNIITASFLQGLGKSFSPAYHLLFAIGIKIAGNILLVPKYGVNGAAFAMLAAFAVSAILNAISLRKSFPKIRMNKGIWLIQTGFALLIMAVVVWLSIQSVHALLPATTSDRVEATFAALISIGLGAIGYILTLLKVKAVTPSDFAVIPSVERAMTNALERLKFPSDSIRQEGE